ncbi:Urea ABC transporter, substrate binding protein UrtA [Labilithrix luteola]|uniref:histidine kinase n=1 Tax=Labilithrix luteola TaxID=1391654 RepID=A0A0K1Q3N8_9BACT|nr:transporter substrate-binding protein [Labilithrix luteola]AKV00242.1 Urea ABC transporter, substrate binding protein UrtA [Labilithrix luteola]
MQASRQKSVKIGLIHSLTGTMSSSELPLLTAERMAIDEINASGGVLGYRIEPEIADGESEASSFARRAEELDRVGSKALFGCWTSASRKAVKRVVEEADNVLYYPVQYEGLEQSENIFYLGSCLNQQAAPALDWAIANLGPRVLLVGSDYVFPRVANRLIRSIVKAHPGREVVAERYVQLGAQDFSAVVDEIRRLSPSVVINSLNGESNLGFFRQCRAAGITAKDIPILSLSAAEPEMQPVVDSAEGHYACWSYFQIIDTPDNDKFVFAYRARNGMAQLCSAPIVTAYSQIMLWRQAVEDAGTFESAAVRQSTVGCEVASPAGPMTILPNHHTPLRAHVGRLRGDCQFEIVWSSPAPIEPLPWLGVETSNIENKAIVQDAMASFPEAVHYAFLLELEIEQRRRAQEELREAHDRLEERVRERTDALAEANRVVRAEVAVRQRKASELQAIVDNMIEAVVVVNRDGDISTVNGSAARLFGVADLLTPAYAPRMWPDVVALRHVDGTRVAPEEMAIHRALAGTPVVNQDEVLRNQETHRDVYVRASAAPMRTNTGEVTGGVLVLRDVTESMELERLKAQFVEVAAHELKTPVAIMKTCAQALLGLGDDVLPAQRNKMLARIDRGAVRIDRIITDLLKVSRLASGQLELSLEPVELSRLVIEAVDGIAPAPQKHRIRPRTAEPIIVRADRDRIQQVIANLVDNAVRYSPAGGDVEVSVMPADHEAIVSVRDHGVGIPQDKQGLIFNRFYRAHTGTPYDYGGMGIGLYLCREIVQRHGGRIWFESEEARQHVPFQFAARRRLGLVNHKARAPEGRTGLVNHKARAPEGRTGLRGARIPMEDFTMGASQRRADVTRVEPARRKVLVIEDDVDLLETVAEVIESLGVEVVQAHNGVEGLAAVERGMPDLILLDMKMPVMNGWEFAQQFHDRHGHGAPIVVVTAASDARQRAVDVGAEGWLDKPFAVDALLKLVSVPPVAGSPLTTDP